MGNNAVRHMGDQYGSNTSTSTATATIDQPVDHHSISPSTVGVSTLAHHLYHFEITSQVPEGLSNYVTSPKKTQCKWYKKLSNAWIESKPPPKTPEEVSRLVIRILKGYQTRDLEGLLSFYDLPFPHSLVELTTGDPPLLADGLRLELHTLPVDPRAVQDGDGVTVYVSTFDTWESSRVPHEIQIAWVERNKARAERNYTKADALHKQIKNAGYGVLYIDNELILAKKYRIRLRGIDAPEMSMPYGKEAKDELVKIISRERLKILIFDEDQYGRFVGDVYCNGIFVQESLLKKGLAWHYTAYDKRPELAKWEKDARAKRIGLWASSNPEMPWVWRKNRREPKLNETRIAVVIMGIIISMLLATCIVYLLMDWKLYCSIMVLCIYRICSRYQ